MKKKLDTEAFIKDAQIPFLFGVSFGIFLFILFFQPFEINNFQLNNLLIFNLGFGAIILILLILIRVAFNFIFQDYGKSKMNPPVSYFMGMLLILSFGTTAFTFYLRYVGSIPISIYLVFKVVLICIFLIISLFLYDLISDLRSQVVNLFNENIDLKLKLENYQESYLNKTVEFISEYNSENLVLPIADIVLIRSANNYVEIIYKDGEKLNKELIRNTLKNIEQQLKIYSNFIRCHRMWVINIYYVEKLTKNLNNNFIFLKEFPEKIPVSRQYIMQIKELL